MVSAEMVADLMRENTKGTYVELVTFRAKGQPAGYMAINTEDVVSRGQTYRAVDFMGYKPMRKSGEELSSATMTFSNVSRELIAEIRQSFEEPTIEVELIEISRPDAIEETSGELDVFRATYGYHSITVEMGAPDIFNEQTPYGQFLPSTFPGVFF